jgi:hypothetical protein
MRPHGLVALSQSGIAVPLAITSMVSPASMVNTPGSATSVIVRLLPV